MSDIKIIVAAQVEQEFEAASAVAALKDAGIEASYKPTASESVLGLPGAMGCPDSFDILIPEDKREEAAEVLAVLGCINSEDTEDESVSGKSAEEKQSEKTPQTLNDLMPDNPVLATVYKVLLAFMALAFLAGFVWLSDTVIAWFMGLFR